MGLFYDLLDGDDIVRDPYLNIPGLDTIDPFAGEDWDFMEPVASNPYTPLEYDIPEPAPEPPDDAFPIEPDPYVSPVDPAPYIPPEHDIPDPTYEPPDDSFPLPPPENTDIPDATPEEPVVEPVVPEPIPDESEPIPPDGFDIPEPYEPPDDSFPDLPLPPPPPPPDVPPYTPPEHDIPEPTYEPPDDSFPLPPPENTDTPDATPDLPYTPPPEPSYDLNELRDRLHRQMRLSTYDYGAGALPTETGFMDPQTSYWASMALDDEALANLTAADLAALPSSVREALNEAVTGYAQDPNNYTIRPFNALHNLETLRQIGEEDRFSRLMDSATRSATAFGYGDAMRNKTTGPWWLELAGGV